jgi:hypothetical protein
MSNSVTGDSGFDERRRSSSESRLPTVPQSGYGTVHRSLRSPRTPVERPNAQLERVSFNSVLRSLNLNPATSGIILRLYNESTIVVLDSLIILLGYCHQSFIMYCLVCLLLTHLDPADKSLHDPGLRRLDPEDIKALRTLSTENRKCIRPFFVTRRDILKRGPSDLETPSQRLTSPRSGANTNPSLGSGNSQHKITKGFRCKVKHCPKKMKIYTRRGDATNHVASNHRSELEAGADSDDFIEEVNFATRDPRPTARKRGWSSDDSTSKRRQARLSPDSDSLVGLTRRPSNTAAVTASVAITDETMGLELSRHEDESLAIQISGSPTPAASVPCNSNPFQLQENTPNYTAPINYEQQAPAATFQQGMHTAMPTQADFDRWGGTPVWPYAGDYPHDFTAPENYQYPPPPQ